MCKLRQWVIKKCVIYFIFKIRTYKPHSAYFIYRIIYVFFFTFNIYTNYEPDVFLRNVLYSTVTKNTNRK